MSNQPAQFSLRSLLLVTSCVAVVLALLVQRNGHVLLLPLVTAACFCAAASTRRTELQVAFGIWGIVAGILAVAHLELVSGYNTRLPFIGKAPSPLSIMIEVLLATSVWFAIALAFRQGIRGVRRANIFNKLLSAIFLLGLLGTAWFLLSIGGYINFSPALAFVLLIVWVVKKRCDERRTLNPSLMLIESRPQPSYRDSDRPRWTGYFAAGAVICALMLGVVIGLMFKFEGNSWGLGPVSPTTSRWIGNGLGMAACVAIAAGAFMSAWCMWYGSTKVRLLVLLPAIIHWFHAIGFIGEVAERAMRL